MSIPNPKQRPPCDSDAERAVLASCMLSATSIDEVMDILRPEHFYVPAHAAIWEAIVDIQKLGQPVDIVTIRGRLEATGKLAFAEGVRYLADLIDATPSVSNVRTYAETVVLLAKLRRAIALCHEKAASGYQASADVPAFLDQLEVDVLVVAQEDQAEQGEWMETLVESVYRNAEAVKNGEIDPGTLTGFAALDDKTGGFHEGDLIILGGRPGMGKTSLALCFARNIAVRGPVAFFSPEMPKEQLTQRLLVAQANTSLLALRRGKSTEQEWAYFAMAADVIAKLPIYIDDSSGLTMSNVRSRTRRLQSELRRKGEVLLGVFVDYLQLLASEDEKANRETQVARTSREAKQMAKALRIPVVLLASLNRDVEKREHKRPQLSDLRESGQIEFDADEVLFVYRPGYYEEAEKTRQRAESGDTSPEREETDDEARTELIIAKQRNGPVGSVNLRWWGASSTFTPWEST